MESDFEGWVQSHFSEKNALKYWNALVQLALFPSFVLSGFWMNCRKRKTLLSLKNQFSSIRWFSIDKNAFEKHLDEILQQRELKTCSFGFRGMSRVKVNRTFSAHQNSTAKTKIKCSFSKIPPNRKKKLAWDLYARSQWLLIQKNEFDCH